MLIFEGTTWVDWNRVPSLLDDFSSEYVLQVRPRENHSYGRLAVK